MNVRDQLRNFLVRFRDWLRLHRRGVLLALWFIFSFTAGGAYPLLAPIFFQQAPSLFGSKIPLPFVFGSSAVKEKPHPISGVFYSAAEAGSWNNHRPLAVMIDNHELARPQQFGLQKADLIYEAVAEGGITRFLAVFHGQDVEKLGPVRSARVYYIDWALQFPAYYAHVGGAETEGSPANIYDYIAAKNVLTLNQFYLGSRTYTYGGDVLLGSLILSHLDYTSTQKLWEAGEYLYPGTNTLPNFATWKFKAEAPYVERPAAQEIPFDFWVPSAYAGRWVYDNTDNVYRRYQSGRAHIDQATGKQLAARNVILSYMNEYAAGDGTAHRLYKTIGQGDALIFRDGKEIPATWKRPTLSSRMLFYERGTDREVEFNRGLTFIEVISK